MRNQVFALTVAVLIVSTALLGWCQPPTPIQTPTIVPTNTVSVPVVTTGETLRIRVAEYALHYYRGSSGEWTGLDVEMARALVERAGFKPEFVELPWSRGLREMETGEIHLMANLAQTPERTVYMEWVGPERESQMALAVLPENEKLVIKSLDDLAVVSRQLQLKFGIQRDLFYSQEFNDRLKNPEFEQWFEYSSDATLNPGKTKTGRIIGFFEDKDSLKYLIATNPAYAGLLLHSFTLPSEPVYFGISKKGVDSETLGRLQAAYTQLEKDGTFEKIRNRDWK